MSKKNRLVTDRQRHCACLIHGDGYDWRYVDNLHSMIRRHIDGELKLHVFTEHDRSVPPHMIKHNLTEWPGIKGPKKSWWYKMQLFNPEHYHGDLLYFDLDVVIMQNISWMFQLSTEKFWAIKDFRYLQKDSYNSINSSVMWWNTDRYAWVWDKFNAGNIEQTIRQYPGDQDYLNATIDYNERRYMEAKYFQSYRWQVLDGGYDFRRRRANLPDTGAEIAGDTSVIVFHGQPKPHEVRDPKIRNLWC
jgi:hypothetical protein